MTIDDLDRLRLNGLRTIVAAAWLCVLAELAIGVALGTPGLAVVLVAGVGANLLPTLATLRREHDAPARMMAGTLAAIHPALGVYLLGGHLWQMDGHMYFFVALSALALLCDWRPILLASTLIAVHHLALEMVAPTWVFTGNGDLGRVVIHAVAVILQAAVLSYLALQLRQLLVRQTQARRESEALAREAIERRGEAERALAAASAAQAGERAERDRRLQLEREAAAVRHAGTLAFAAAFQSSVAGIVETVGRASRELEGSARALSEVAGRASRETAESARGATDSSVNTGALAAQIGDLSGSINAIADSIDRQARLSGKARGVSQGGRDAVRALAERSASISQFVVSVQRIASRTNLLSLNATIEAARAGEVGRGFAVVAQEVKQLAGQASDVTSEIGALAASMEDGSAVAHAALDGIAAMVTDLADAADTIRAALDRQRVAADAIEANAQETAERALSMAGRIESVAAVAGETEMLSVQVAGAASALSDTARSLQHATDNLVAQLKAA